MGGRSSRVVDHYVLRTVDDDKSSSFSPSTSSKVLGGDDSPVGVLNRKRSTSGSSISIASRDASNNFGIPQRRKEIKSSKKFPFLLKSPAAFPTR